MPRYGLTTPTITSQIFGFSTMTIYQYVVLTPVSRFSKINLNFALCHTPADPGFDMFGYHYFFYGFMYLGLLSYMTRLILYPARWIVMAAISKIRGNSPDKVKEI
jgi:hypothetical protein